MAGTPSFSNETVWLNISQLIGSRNGAYIKTYMGKSTYYPPQGGGNGTGSVKNVCKLI